MAKVAVFKSDVEAPKAYCMKCKKKGCVVKDGNLVLNGNRAFYKGTHKKCGSNVSVVVGKDKYVVKSSKAKTKDKAKKKKGE